MHLVRFEPHGAFSWGNRALFALILCYPSNLVIFNLVPWVALAPVGALPYMRARCPAPCTWAMSYCKLINWCAGFYITLLWIWINTKSPQVTEKWSWSAWCFWTEEQWARPSTAATASTMLFCSSSYFYSDQDPDYSMQWLFGKLRDKIMCVQDNKLPLSST